MILIGAHLSSCPPEVHWLPKPFFLPSSNTLNSNKVLSSHHSAQELFKMRKGFSRSEFHLFQFDWYPNKTFTTHPCTQSSRLSCKKRFSVTERFSSIFITACARCPWKSVNMEEEKLYKNWEYRHVYRLPWTLNKLLHLTPIELPVKQERLGLWVVGIRSVV